MANWAKTPIRQLVNQLDGWRRLGGLKFRASDPNVLKQDSALVHRKRVFNSHKLRIQRVILLQNVLANAGARQGPACWLVNERGVAGTAPHLLPSFGSCMAMQGQMPMDVAGTAQRLTVVGFVAIVLWGIRGGAHVQMWLVWLGLSLLLSSSAGFCGGASTCGHLGYVWGCKWCSGACRSHRLQVSMLERMWGCRWRSVVPCHHCRVHLQASRVHVGMRLAQHIASSSSSAGICAPVGIQDV